MWSCCRYGLLLEKGKGIELNTGGIKKTAVPYKYHTFINIFVGKTQLISAAVELNAADFYIPGIVVIEDVFAGIFLKNADTRRLSERGAFCARNRSKRSRRALSGAESFPKIRDMRHERYQPKAARKIPRKLRIERQYRQYFRDSRAR